MFPRLREHIDYTFRYLPRPGPKARLLDVGCGNGQWLEQARSSGWHVSGVDFDQFAVVRARAAGLDVRLGSIEAWADADEVFDAVTMSHVIEHVPDPGQLVRAAFDLLQPGGTLYIDTPNIDAPTHARFGRLWRGLEAPRHFIILSEQALLGLIEAAGFERVKRHRAPGATEFLIAASEAMQRRDGSSRTSAPTQQSEADLSPEFLTITCRRPPR
ncbi:MULTISPECIES: class I SAM-dependent methyltransferase [Sphingomonas]|uniref:class I SAM-dependent methyltransferase n=1 Tax=Sphingomonas TaxID=13687 RepID=UPI0013B45241|nr:MULTISPECIES: class I SAM-dependent methyltransferase [Sphingomonas]